MADPYREVGLDHPELKQPAPTPEAVEPMEATWEQGIEWIKVPKDQWEQVHRERDAQQKNANYLYRKYKEQWDRAEALATPEAVERVARAMAEQTVELFIPPVEGDGWTDDAMVFWVLSPTSKSVVWSGRRRDAQEWLHDWRERVASVAHAALAAMREGA